MNARFIVTAALASLASLVGCSDPAFELGRADASDDVELVADSGNEREDADSPDTTVADSGVKVDSAVVDTGVTFDSAKPDTKADSYTPPMDSYVPPRDSYVPPMDSYVPPMDSYVPPPDSYVPPPDSWVYDTIITPIDSSMGDKCSGVACIGTMTCCPYTGACYEPACLGCCMPSSGGGG